MEVLESLPQLAPLAKTIKHTFVLPLLEKQIEELEHFLHQHKEIVREKEKQLDQVAHSPPIKQEPDIKEEQEMKDIKPFVKEVVIGDIVPIKKEEEEEVEEMDVDIKKIELIKETHKALEEHLTKKEAEMYGTSPELVYHTHNCVHCLLVFVQGCRKS